MDPLNYDFHKFMEQMKEVTANLKKMNEAQSYMRWQFDWPDEYEEFVKEMTKADGWMSSHC